MNQSLEQEQQRGAREQQAPDDRAQGGSGLGGNLKFVSENATLQALQSDLNGSHLYSQGTTSLLLGVSEKSLREWNRDLAWVFYWVSDTLIHKGQYTRAGLFALADLQMQTRRKTLLINQQQRIERDKKGKARVNDGLPKMTLQQYAAAIWMTNGVHQNPMPYVIGNPDQGTLQSIKEILETHADQYQQQQAQQHSASATSNQHQQQHQQHQQHPNQIDTSITSLVFQPAVIDAEFADEIESDITDLVTVGDGNTGGWVQHLLDQAELDGKVLGTVLGKVTIAQLEQAKNEVIEQYGQRSTVASEVQQRVTKTQHRTKKV